MNTRFWQRLFFISLAAAWLLLLIRPVSSHAAPPADNSLQAEGPIKLSPYTSASFAPLDNAALPPAARVEMSQAINEAERAMPAPGWLHPASSAVDMPANQADALLQNINGTASMTAPLINFEGIPNLDGLLPPDTDGEVGPNHYVQMVNISMAVFTKQGNLAYGPFYPGDLWPVGDICRDNNDGDPVVLYDQFADRWLISQFALPYFSSGPFYECIAISKTGTPTNIPADWWAYTIKVSDTKMNDYPKLAVWPDAYYMTVNQFNEVSLSWAGAGVFAFDRAKMIQGQASSFQFFDLAAVNMDFGGMLPVDLDGNVLPPAGSPGYFVEVDDGSWIGPADALRIWEFHVDWVDSDQSTFGINGQPNNVLDVAPFDLLPCTVNQSRACIPQPGTATRLDALADRLMFRAAYRNFGEHETVVLNHTVKASGTDTAGIRWYEIRDPGGSPAIYQQGTFAPDDGAYRWMGSLAQDNAGNLALGYSVSSSTVYPSIRYAGRLVDDPLNTLAQSEVSIIEGSGAQLSSYSRWGDYSAMSVDPLDDCTFWYTQEYIQTTASAAWRTRVAAFRFPNCAAGAQGNLAGVVTDGSANPIAGVSVQVQSASQWTQGSTSNALGEYSFSLPADTYTVTATAFGYLPAAYPSIEVSADLTTTLDITLQAAPIYTVTGRVLDALTGWPIYAQVTVDGYPGDPVWTDPITGEYLFQLIGGSEYSIAAEDFSTDYLPARLPTGILGNDLILDILLQVDSRTCSATGYTLEITPVLMEAFDSTSTPTDWSVSNNGGTCTWRFDNPRSRTNLTGGDSNFAIADSDACGEGTTMNTDLISPLIDVEELSTTWLSFRYDYWNFEPEEIAAVDIQVDDGSWQRMVSWNSDQRGPATYLEDVSSVLSSASTARLRFHYEGPGWEWWWQVDDVFLGERACLPQAGGLVVGHVSDANTGLSLNDALVSGPAGTQVKTAATPLDPAVADGFYAIYTPAGSQVITATLGKYEPAFATVQVAVSAANRQDFALKAGQLSYSPSALSIRLPSPGVTSSLVTLENTGSAEAAYEILELRQDFLVSGPFESGPVIVKPFKQEALTAAGVSQPIIPAADPYPAGEVLQTWPTQLAYGWGLGYNTHAGDLWIADLSINGGTDLAFRYLPNGTQTGDTFSLDWSGSFAADMAYNLNTGTLWEINVGGDNCIYEIDPATRSTTGNTICPGFTVSQRGLAYDPDSDTYFSGSWNDGVLHHFKPDGTLISSRYVGLNIAGLAYNPQSGHLFAITNSTPTTLYVIDVLDQDTIIGEFSIDGFSGSGGAGLEMDCDGYLWAVDQLAQTVYQVTSSEPTTLCGGQEIEWISEMPTSGILLPGETEIITVSLDASDLQPGEYHAQLKFSQQTPYLLANLPLTLTIGVELRGTVYGKPYPSAALQPLNDAILKVEAANGAEYQAISDESGSYQFWMDPASDPPLVLQVDADGYVPLVLTDILLPESVNVLNLTLSRWMHFLTIILFAAQD